jgi:hypothetical protein
MIAHAPAPGSSRNLFLYCASKVEELLIGRLLLACLDSPIVRPVTGEQIYQSVRPHEDPRLSVPALEGAPPRCAAPHTNRAMYGVSRICACILVIHPSYLQAREPVAPLTTR